MSKIRPTWPAEATNRCVRADGLFAQDTDEDDEEEDEQEPDEPEEEDDSDGYSE